MWADPSDDLDGCDASRGTTGAPIAGSPTPSAIPIFAETHQTPKQTVRDMTTEIQTGFSNESFAAFLAARREPKWLSEGRQEAWDAFQELPVPHSRMEEWRRTDIRTLNLNRFGPPRPEETPQTIEGVLHGRIEPAGSLVTRDGCVASAHVAESPGGAALYFGSLEDAADQGIGDVASQLNSVVDPHYDKFAALHAALWSAGAFLYVPAGVKVEQPFYLLRGLSEGRADFGHTLVILEEGAEATLLTESVSTDPTGDGAGLHCGGVEIVVGKGARLRFVDFQNWNRGTWHFSHQRAVVEEDASLEWTVGALGARLAKVNQHVVLAGPNAQAMVNGVMFTEGRQHHSYHTLQHHQAPYCHSDLLYKGALQDHSRMVWRGMIRVDQGAVKTDGYQRNDNLILSNTSRADSIPGLEIEADDVRCTHGATAGRVDDEEIFYLQTRGLTRREAARMIVTGFFQQVFDRVTIDSVREELQRVIRHRVREYR